MDGKGVPHFTNTSHVSRFSEVSWFAEKAERAACHLSPHLKCWRSYQSRRGVEGLRGASANHVTAYPCMSGMESEGNVSQVLWLCFFFYLDCSCFRLESCSSPVRRVLVYEHCPWYWTERWVVHWCIQTGSEVIRSRMSELFLSAVLTCAVYTIKV